MKEKLRYPCPSSSHWSLSAQVDLRAGPQFFEQQTSLRDWVKRQGPLVGQPSLTLINMNGIVNSYLHHVHFIYFIWNSWIYEMWFIYIYILHDIHVVINWWLPWFSLVLSDFCTCSCGGDPIGKRTTYPLVMTNSLLIIEHDHRNSGSSHGKWWFST